MELIYFFIALGIAAIAVFIFARTKTGKKILE
jgi:hypothetical protein